ncbi:MAG: leucine-rich repeat domain-containing protein [Isosphaeraceae bacterium]
MTIDDYAQYIYLAGLALLALGCLGVLIRAFRHWRKGLFPLALIGLGLAVTAFPPAYRLLVPIDLGPRERIVEGQRHITLTGWDRKDYGLLGSKRDVAVLQMANPDVTDQTLERLRGMDRLEELDLNNTQITDAGLKVLRGLPSLVRLRLKNTKITDQGFRESLADKATLMQLDLTGTQVSPQAVDEWRKARPGRRALR